MGDQDLHEHYLVPWAVQQEAKYPLITSGEGVYFSDDRGKRYLDFSSQLMNLNLGYNNEAIKEAIKEQLDQLAFIGPAFATEAKICLSRLLAELTPGSLSKAFYTTGGSTANEIALFMAKMYTGRPKVMTRNKSYHGSTWETLSISGDERRISASASAGDVVRYPDPYCYRCSMGHEPASCELRCLKVLEETVQLEGPETIAAIFAEPITGTNRCIVPPEDYYAALKKICTKYGILFVADEVITGFGRTGQWFGIEHWGIEPDMITAGKGINSCYVPLGAVMVSEAIAGFFDDRYLPIGYTNSGHPLACASALASINYCLEHNILEQVRDSGGYLKGILEELQQADDIIGEVRGKGLQLCLELVANRETREPLPPQVMSTVQRKLMERGLYTLVRWNIIFIAPPLIVSKEEIDRGMEIIGDVLAKIRP